MQVIFKLNASAIKSFSVQLNTVYYLLKLLNMLVKWGITNKNHKKYWKNLYFFDKWA